MLFIQLLSFSLLAAANPLLTAREANNGGGRKACCSAPCYQKLEYGDKNGKGQFSSYCSSYFKATATPCPKTVTETAYNTKTTTVTVTSGQNASPTSKAKRGGDQQGLEVRNNPAPCTPKVSRPTSVPAFAQKECNQANLSSACSCLGATPKTNTIAQPTTTTTTTRYTTTTQTVTVTPCTTTSTCTISTTTTSTVSVTSATVTATTTINTTATSTDTTTVVVSVPVSATLATATATITADPSTTTITTTVETSTSTETDTETDTATVTVTTTVYGVRKRDSQPSAYKMIEDRAVTSIRPLPEPPTKNTEIARRNSVPKPCSVVTTTSTKTISTTATVSKTATVTSSVTTTVATSTTTATAFSSTTYTVTLTATDTTTTTPTVTATSSVTATTTTTTTVTTTTTTTATATVIAACNVYKFVATSGTYAGQFISGGKPSQEPNMYTYGFVRFGTTADSFTLRSDGKVYDDNVYGWISQGSSLYYILQMTDYSQSYYGTPYVFCTVGNGDSGYPGAAGSLTCSLNGSPITLVSCPQLSNNLGKASGSIPDGCTAVNLAAIPACS